ncbi:MAG: LysR substrate-binding domain-containing protein [Janthinobacterium lividum]
MPKLQLTLKDLHYVVALADHGHFGRAAAACNISQPTLSTQVKKLEQDLGLTLFERTTQSVSVTDLGRDIVGRARRILAEVEAIGSVGHDQANPLSGMFRLGVIPTLGPYLLPWLVPALKGSYPELRLTVREDLTVPLLERLHLNRLDAVLVALPIDEDGLDTVPMFDEPFRFAEPRGDGPVATGIMDEAELRGQRLLLLTEGHCLRDQALAICATSDPELDGDFRATSLETIVQMVATGLGNTLLPAMACGSETTRGITTRPLAPGLNRRIGLAWRRGSARIRDIHLVGDIVRDNVPSSVDRV